MHKIMNGLIFLLHNFQCNARKYEIIKFSIHQFTKKHQKTKKKEGLTYLIVVCPKITVKIVARIGTHFLVSEESGIKLQPVVEKALLK